MRLCKWILYTIGNVQITFSSWISFVVNKEAKDASAISRIKVVSSIFKRSRFARLTNPLPKITFLEFLSYKLVWWNDWAPGWKFAKSLYQQNVISNTNTAFNMQHLSCNITKNSYAAFNCRFQAKLYLYYRFQS